MVAGFCHSCDSTATAMARLDYVDLLLLMLLLIFGVRPSTGRGCNKTIRTSKIIGSPRLTISNKGKLIHCVYRLAPSTIDTQDIFEIAFRHFNIPTVSSEAPFDTCSPAAYLRIADAGRPPDQVGSYCGNLLSSFTTRASHNPSPRRFFLSPASFGPLVIEFHADGFGPETRFEAAISVLPRRLAIERHKELALPQPGSPVSNDKGYCDRIFLNCRGPCDIASPGYPGFYPRNVTCRHMVIYNETSEMGGRIVVGGQYFDVFDVGTPEVRRLQRGWRRRRSGEHSDEVAVDACPGDYVAVRDWLEGTSTSVEIARFCGKGLFPSVVARARSVIVEFHSSPHGSMDHDGFYLTVDIVRPSPRPRIGEVMPESECFWKFTAMKEGFQGEFHSPGHWYPPGTECTYLIEGKLGQKVRIYLSFFQAKGNTCDFDRLTLYDGGDLVGSYCTGERTSKKRLKGMVRDSSNNSKGKKAKHLPSYGNSLSPSEPYMSQSDVVRLVFHSEGGSFDGRQFVFTVSYAFLEEKSIGNQMLVDASGCQMLVRSEDGSSGPFSLLADRLPLLLATTTTSFNFDKNENESDRDKNGPMMADTRGSVDCYARFVGRASERVKLEFHKVTFGSNRSATITSCDSEDFPITDDVIYIMDGGHHHSSRPLGCIRASTFFDTHDHPFVFYSSVNEMRLRLQLHRISSSAHADLSIYRFEGLYHFQRADSGCGDSSEMSQSGHHGVIRFPPFLDATDSDDAEADGPLHCSWSIQVTPGRQAILKLQYFFLPSDCHLNKVTIRFFGDNSVAEGEVVLCRENATSLMEILPPDWGRPWPAGVERRYASIELWSQYSKAGIRFALRWSEIFPKKLIVARRMKKGGVVREEEEMRDNPDCDFECPDGISCLSSTAICDGSIDCPQTNFTGLPLDERCEGRSNPANGEVDVGATQWVLFVAPSIGVAFVVLLLALSVFMVIPKKQGSQSSLLRSSLKGPLK
ncbi:uncharacterized protein LOC124171006 [Ischnura elegans]|uniref:uncharacterized protein LOC124171006 n=1 Tax=Ischnura elegans TaxID=197161 RepID=UPI001ED895A6|nr:uncharacterized protein LOC124171006 [Ischnura elegans]